MVRRKAGSVPIMKRTLEISVCALSFSGSHSDRNDSDAKPGCGGVVSEEDREQAKEIRPAGRNFARVLYYRFPCGSFLSTGWSLRRSNHTSEQSVSLLPASIVSGIPTIFCQRLNFFFGDRAVFMNDRHSLAAGNNSCISALYSDQAVCILQCIRTVKLCDRVWFLYSSYTFFAYAALSNFSSYPSHSNAGISFS